MEASIIIHLSVVAVSLLLVFVAARWPQLARLLLVALFGWAGVFNLRLGITNVAEYLDFARYTPVDAYRDFILGFFARHATAMVASIAVGQLAIACLLTARRPASTLGALGAIFFFVAIAPLGAGSAFPSSLLLAVATGIVAWRCGSRSLVGELTSSYRAHRRARRARPEARAR